MKDEKHINIKFHFLKEHIKNKKSETNSYQDK